MRSIIYLSLLFILFSCDTPAPQQEPSALSVSHGRVVRHENFESKHVDARNVDVWLPDGYDSNQKYAVLYMHDGQMLYDSTTTWNGQEWGVDETVSRLINKGEIGPCIVVGAWNSGKNRHPDYFPQKPIQFLPQAFRDSLLHQKRSEDTPLFANTVRSDRYLKFLVEELKPFIDQTYSTKTDQANTFVAGSSMGGLISMYAICEYPEIFRGAACLSTHWVGIFEAENNPIPAAFVAYLNENLPDPKSHKIYFDYGTETLDALYEPFQLMADSVMQLNNYDSNSWITKKFEGANHSEHAWRERLDIPLSFIMGK